ncbi:hypothetical protein ACFQZW_13040 [Lutibacter aestuarii]|uniref:Uncharacterized protein n=1 Tax=Lutibacter aestuarii TaxID=861111 RepID=A0ABW2Z8F2_9FLAO
MVQAVVDVNDFMNHLKDNQLVIIHKDDLRIKDLIAERALEKVQKKLLKQPALKPSEVIKYKLTKYKVVHGLTGFIKRNYPEHLYKGKDGVKMVTRTVIEIIRNLQNLD